MGELMHQNNLSALTFGPKELMRRERIEQTPRFSLNQKRSKFTPLSNSEKFEPQPSASTDRMCPNSRYSSSCSGCPKPANIVLSHSSCSAAIFSKC